MKIHIVIFLLVLGLMAVRPPAPTCRVFPVPQILPVSVEETVRFDLEALFDGNNIIYSRI